MSQLPNRVARRTVRLNMPTGRKNRNSAPMPFRLKIKKREIQFSPSPVLLFLLGCLTSTILFGAIGLANVIKDSQKKTSEDFAVLSKEIASFRTTVEAISKLREGAQKEIPYVKTEALPPDFTKHNDSSRGFYGQALFYSFTCPGNSSLECLMGAGENGPFLSYPKDKKTAANKAFP